VAVAAAINVSLYHFTRTIKASFTILQGMKMVFTLNFGVARWSFGGQPKKQITDIAAKI